jgi:hypothetical protein
MRVPLFLTAILLCFSTQAQPHLPVDLTTLPGWMVELVTGKKPANPLKPTRAPLHTNAFIGTWTVEFKGGRRIEYWGDAHRMVLRELNGPFTLQRATLLDLQHNVRMQARWGGQQVGAKVEDLYIPQAGYFHDLWNDSLTATGRTAEILGHTCREFWGTSNKRDSSWYWTTTAHPKLFSDLKVWARWLTEGDLEHLLAFADRHAGAALRVTWSKHEYGPPAGGMEFIAITPGRVPMPELPMTGALLVEQRLAWINNSGTGRLPEWMRTFLGNLPPDSLPLAYSPDPVDRGIPDNRFIGTLTAETPTRYIDEHNDTTLRVAKYSYWADARRAVLQLNDPEDEGTIFYAVDLDADVVMVSRNEGHGHVIPKLEIASLETVGLHEFGRGLELEFTPQGRYQTILGRRCELYTAPERYLHFFWFPQDSVVNPVFDMRNWLVQRIGQQFKDLMFFGVADKPMPMAVMGTQLTSYKLGKAKPPVVDLSKCIVRDERLRERRRRDREVEVPEIQVREITVEDVMRGDDVAVEVAEEPVAMEEIAPASGATYAPPVLKLEPAMDSLMKATTNRFIGTATLRFTSLRGDKTTTWTVRYASTADRMVIIGRDEQPEHTEHTYATLIDRRAGTETNYLMVGGELRSVTRTMDSRFASPFPPATRDSVLTDTRTFLGRDAQHRLVEDTDRGRESWVDVKTPSLFHDVLSARKSWGGVEVLLRGPMVTSTRAGMPLRVNYRYRTEETMVMKVLELKPGAVDPQIFEITPASFR